MTSLIKQNLVCGNLHVCILGYSLSMCAFPLPFTAYVDSTLLLSDSYVNVARLNVQSEVDAITLIPKKKAIGALAQSRDFALLDLLSEQQVGTVVVLVLLHMCCLHLMLFSWYPTAGRGSEL